MDMKMKKIPASYREISVSIDSTFYQKILVFTTFKSTANSGGQFEVTACVPVTISNYNFKV
jgi:hypothetical protein